MELYPMMSCLTVRLELDVPTNSEQHLAPRMFGEVSPRDVPRCNDVWSVVVVLVLGT